MKMIGKRTCCDMANWPIVVPVALRRIFSSRSKVAWFSFSCSVPSSFSIFPFSFPPSWNRVFFIAPRFRPLKSSSNASMSFIDPFGSNGPVRRRLRGSSASAAVCKEVAESFFASLSPVIVLLLLLLATGASTGTVLVSWSEWAFVRPFWLSGVVVVIVAVICVFTLSRNDFIPELPSFDRIDERRRGEGGFFTNKVRVAVDAGKRSMSDEIGWSPVLFP